MSQFSELIRRIDSCPVGGPGWKEWEDVCIETLTLLFVPPLEVPKLQPRTYSGIDRRDAIFPNRNVDKGNNWGFIHKELAARLVLCEFKNYDTTEIGKEEVNQTRNYLTEPMGRLALLCCNKAPERAAYIKRNNIYSTEKKVILFLTKEEMKEMLIIKERGADPADLIMDLIELFYMQHE